MKRFCTWFVINRRKLFALMLSIPFAASCSAGFAEDDWSNQDFMFYDQNMTVIERPVTGEYLGHYINLKKDEPGQTFRGLKVGSYWEELAEKYDLKDAEWAIYDTDENASGGVTERVKELREKWKSEGKTGADVLSMADFLCAKGYYFYIKLHIYREDGHFRTLSEMKYTDFVIDEEERDIQIDRALEGGYSGKTREELEAVYEELIREDYLSHHLRAEFQVRIKNSRVDIIEVTDYYYGYLSSVYKDDGTIDEYYAYVLDLK